MLRIEKQTKQLVSLSQLQPRPLSEIPGLHELILGSPEQFFGELGENLFVIQEDIWPREARQVRADLLAVDQRGVAVAVLLPDSGGQAQLARAITSLGVIGNWKPDDILRNLKDAGKQNLRTFMGGNLNEMNFQQRAILLAETFDEAVLAATRWLRERAGLGISCLRLSLGVDSCGNEYLSCADVSDSSLSAHRLLGLNGADRSIRAPAEEPAESRQGEERRKQQRTRKYDTQHLKLGHAGQMLAVTNLIDLSDGGLGAEVTSALPVGSKVTVAGDLHGSESAVKLEGHARVAHCRGGRDGVFRVGLLFEQISCQNLY